MKIKLVSMFFVVLIGLFLLSGCGKEIKPEITKVIDCGENEDCFYNSLETCTPTKFVGGLGPQIQFRITIEGSEGDNCIIHYLCTENPMPEFKNTEMDCKIPKGIYSSESYGAYFNQNMVDVCSGTYIDAMLSMMG